MKYRFLLLLQNLGDNKPFERLHALYYNDHHSRATFWAISLASLAGYNGSTDLMFSQLERQGR